MSESQFMAKYQLEDGGSWNNTASRLFWARSYQMPRKQLVEMSLDFLSIPGVGGCSSYHLARETTRYRDESGNVIL